MRGHHSYSMISAQVHYIEKLSSSIAGKNRKMGGDAAQFQWDGQRIERDHALVNSVSLF